MEVTSFITQQLRNSIRFLERIFCYDELRLHAMPLGSRIILHLNAACTSMALLVFPKAIAGWPMLAMFAC